MAFVPAGDHSLIHFLFLSSVTETLLFLSLTLVFVVVAHQYTLQVTAAVSLIETKQLEPSLLLNLEYLQSFLSRVPSIRLHHTSIR